MIANGGNWTDTTKWAASDISALANINDGATPTASDDVFLTANSGQCTISSASVGKSLTCTGYTNTLTHNSQNLTISGNITFASGMIYTPNDGPSGSLLTINASGTLTTNGILMSNITHSSGTLTLGDNLSFRADKTNVFSLATSGLDLNGKTIAGNSKVNRIIIRSSVLGTARTVTVSSGTMNGVDIRDITASASLDLSAASNFSGDCGGNTNITFTTAATQTYTGGTGNWSTGASWTSRVPLPQDNVVMSGVTGGTITADMPRLGKSIDWTGAASTPTFTLGLAVTNYGSLNLTGVNSFGGSFTWNFEGRGTFNVTSNGKAFPNQVTIAMVGGTLIPLDALNVTTTFFNLNNGTFTNSGNFSITCGVYTPAASTTTNMGNATWTMSQSGALTLWAPNATATINANSSTILYTNTGVSNQTFAGAGKTYNDFKISGGGSGAVILTGANTFNRIYLDGGGTKTLTFPASTTTTLSSQLTQNFGNGSNVLTINSSSSGTPATISKAVGRFEGGFLSIKDSTAVGTFYAGSNSTNVSGNSGWIFSDYTPGQSGGMMAWLDALDGADGSFNDRLTKTAYTNSGTTRGVKVASGVAMIFDGVSNKLTLGNIGGIYALSFWVKTDTDTEQWIDLNGTQFVQIASGTIAATAWTSPTIYVNGVATTTLGAGVWAHIAVVSATSVTCSAVVLGLISPDYGAFSMTNLKLYDRQLTAREVGQQYNRDKNTP